MTVLLNCATIDFIIVGVPQKAFLSTKLAFCIVFVHISESFEITISDGLEM